MYYYVLKYTMKKNIRYLIFLIINYSKIILIILKEFYIRTKYIDICSYICSYMFIYCSSYQYIVWNEYIFINDIIII